MEQSIFLELEVVGGSGLEKICELVDAESRLVWVLLVQFFFEFELELV